MGLSDWHRNLITSQKVGFWGALAWIAALLFAIGTCILTPATDQSPPIPLGPRGVEPYTQSSDRGNSSEMGEGRGSKPMELSDWYRDLTTSQKVGFRGAVASIAGLFVALTTFIWSSVARQTSPIAPDPGYVEPYTQSGDLRITRTGEFRIHYALPYKLVPNLAFPEASDRGSDHRDSFDVIEERPDGFRIYVHSFSNPHSIRWQARGILGSR